MPKGTWVIPNHALIGRQKIWQKLDDLGWKPPVLNVDKELNFFDNETVHKPLSEYDLFFSNTRVYPLWDKRKIRENRHFLPDLRERIFQQEKEKPVPSMTSLHYGRPCRPFYDDLEIRYRRHTATSDFNRRRGVMRVIEKKAV